MIALEHSEDSTYYWVVWREEICLHPPEIAKPTTYVRAVRGCSGVWKHRD